MKRKYYLMIIGITFLLTISSSLASASTKSENYEADIVMGSGGGHLESEGLEMEVITGVISGETTSLNYQAELGFYFGVENTTMEPVVSINYLVFPSEEIPYLVGNDSKDFREIKEAPNIQANQTKNFTPITYIKLNSLLPLIMTTISIT